MEFHDKQNNYRLPQEELVTRMLKFCFCKRGGYYLASKSIVYTNLRVYCLVAFIVSSTHLCRFSLQDIKNLFLITNRSTGLEKMLHGTKLSVLQISEFTDSGPACGNFSNSWLGLLNPKYPITLFYNFQHLCFVHGAYVTDKLCS